jgi:hypothetical protein
VCQATLHSSPFTIRLSSGHSIMIDAAAQP